MLHTTLQVKKMDNDARAVKTDEDTLKLTKLKLRYELASPESKEKARKKLMDFLDDED